MTSFLSKVAHAITIITNEQFRDVTCFSITTDAWTDVCLRKYVAITYHAIHPVTMTFLSITHDVLFLPTSHTWVAVTNRLRESIQFHFPRDAIMATVTTDNGANFIKMSVALLSTIGIDEIDELLLDSWDEQVTPPQDWEDYGWRCVAHTMHLAIMDVIKEDGTADYEFRNLVKNVHQISSTIRKSSNLRNDLVAMQLVLNSKTLLSMIDEPTRWSTIYYMLGHYDEISQEVQLLAALGKFDEYDFNVPTPHAMMLLRSGVKILSPLEKFIRLLEGEKYVTISLIPKLLFEALQALELSFPHDLAKKLYVSISNRMGWILSRPNFALGAAALDPRIMLHTLVPANVNDDVWDALATWVFEYEECQQKPPTDPLTPTSFVVPNQDFVVALLKQYRQIFENPANAPLLDNTDPLDYWKGQFAISQNASVLRQIILCLFSICATSAPSERAFSVAGRVIQPIRSSLSPHLLEAYITIKSFMIGGSLQHFDQLVALLSDME